MRQNTILIILGALICLTTMSFDSKQEQDKPCSVLKSGWFKMPDAADTTSYVVITSSTQTEYYNFKRYWIRSSVKWISDCECELTVLAVNYPGLLCKRGDKMSLRVLNTEGNIVNFEVLMDGERERGRYLKMENNP
jgi:hypothetical protein